MSLYRLWQHAHTEPAQVKARWAQRWGGSRHKLPFLTRKLPPTDNTCEGKLSVSKFYKPHLRPGPRPSRRRLTQNELSGVFRGFFSLIVLSLCFFPLRIFFFCLYIMFSNFVIVWDFCVCVCVCTHTCACVCVCASECVSCAFLWIFFFSVCLVQFLCCCCCCCCLFSNERREDVDLGEWGGEKELKGAGRGETVTRTYCTKEIYFQ